MPKKFNYDILKSEYSDKQIVELLYNHYYYMVDDFFNNYKGKIDKKEIDEYFKETITKYIFNTNHELKAYKYIYMYIYHFCKRYDQMKNSKEKTETFVKAFNGDNEARSKIFMSYVEAIDDRAKEIYMNFKKKGKSDILITLDDIKQIMYLYIWESINQFYNTDYTDSYYSTRFNTRLERITEYINKYINKLVSTEFGDIERVNYSDSSFISSIENNDYLNNISLKLNDRYKFVLGYVRQGYTYEEIGDMLGITKQAANLLNEKVKELAIRTNNRW